MVATLAIVVFVILLALGLDVGFAMIAAAILGMWLHPAGGIDLAVAPLTLVAAIDSEALIAVALFILAGEIMNHAGLTRRLIDWAMTVVGHFRGALSQAAMTTNLVMAGISGSAVSDATATGSVLIPAMKDDGYKPGYAAAVIAAGAMLGPIIPPSIPMLVYAVMANLSIGRLFLAGVVPGLLLFAGFTVLCAWIAQRRHYQARGRASWGKRLAATRSASWALLVPVLIILGIRSGITTETEAAAAICLYALAVGLFVYRDLKLRQLGQVFFSAARTSGVILFLLAAAGPFSWLMSESHVADQIAGAILAISDQALVILLIVNLLLFAVGMVFEPLPALVLFVPALLPIQAQLGIDPIHFATVIVVNLMAGMLHPPVGLLVLITAAIGRCSLWSVAREALPFLAWTITVLMVITVWPALVLWLPDWVMGR